MKRLFYYLIHSFNKEKCCEDAFGFMVKDFVVSAIEDYSM